MDNAARNELARLQAELRDIKRQMLGIPARWAGGESTKLLLLKIIDGQTVYNVGGTTYYGIKLGGVIGGVGVHYDPNISLTPGAFTAVDGIGRGLIYRDGIADAVPVLIALDFTYPIPNALIDGDYVMTAGTVSIVVGGDPTDTISAYIPLFQ